MPPSGIATIYTPRRFYFFMRRTTPLEPFEPFEPAEPLSHVIKGRRAPRANLEPYLVIELFYFKHNVCSIAGVSIEN